MSILPPSPFIAESSMSTGGHQEAPLAGPPNTRPASGLLDDGPDILLAELVKRGFNEEAFLNEIELLPAFIAAPSQDYLRATELMPVLAALAKF